MTNNPYIIKNGLIVEGDIEADNFPPGELSLSDLTDVDITTTPPADGDLLGWSETDGAFIPTSPPTVTIESIDDISDVRLDANQAPSDGRALIYQNGEIISGPVIGGVNYTLDPDFDPSIIGPSLLAWYDASDASTVTITSGKVSQVNDKSSYARHITQSTDSDRPTYETEVFNGKNALAWPTQNNGVNLRNSSSISFKEVFVVCQYINVEAPNNFGQYATTVSGLNEIIMTGLGAGTGFYTTGFDSFYLNADNAINRSANAFPDIKTLGLLRGYKSTAGTITDTGGLVIGCDRTYSDENNVSINRGWMGYICEILILDAILDENTRALLEYYLAAKWGFVERLPEGHTAITPIVIPYSIGNHDDVDITTNPPSDTDLLGWSSADGAFVPVPRPAGIGAQTLSNTAVSLAVGATNDFALSAGATSLLLSFTASYPCWVRVYGTDAARTVDTRTEPGGTPPLAGSEFYAEVVTSDPGQTIRFSPVPTLQGDSNGTVYIRAVNVDTITRTIDMDFSILTLEA